MNPKKSPQTGVGSPKKASAFNAKRPGYQYPRSENCRWNSVLTLDDFREGRKIDHLSQKEVASMISAMEKRLTKAEERLSKIER